MEEEENEKKRLDEFINHDIKKRNKSFVRKKNLSGMDVSSPRQQM